MYEPADAEWPSGLYREAFKDEHRAAHVLQLLLSSQQWVHRRVEGVVFHNGTTATRRVSVDFTLPSQAPVCAVCARWPGSEGHRRGAEATPSGAAEPPPRLVPITLLPKRSLINFDLRDESGAALPHLELRQNQDLTFALLSVWAKYVLATLPVAGQAAASAGRGRGATTSVRLEDQVRETLERFTYGDRERAGAALGRLRDPGARAVGQLRRLADDPRFRYVLELLAYDFMLLVEVPESLPYRHVYKVSYDTSFLPKHLTEASGEDGGRWRNRSEKLLTAFGWRETSFEFDTPEAKLAQSYHLKVQVPESVEISEAVLLAGSHDQADRSYHLDIAGGRPTVDLHVVEVRPHESARARVVLRARRSGWLGSACLAGLVAFGAVFLVSGQLGALYPLFGQPARPLGLDELTLLATTLAGLSALLATILARPSEHPMSSELLYLLRPLSSLTMLLPFTAAAVLIFVQDPGKEVVAWPFVAVTLVSGLLAVVLLVAWFKARRHSTPTISPWQQDITESLRNRLKRSEDRIWSWPVRTVARRRRSREDDDRPASYQEAERRYGFGRPAVETEVRRHQIALHQSPYRETAALLGDFHADGCPGNVTAPKLRATADAPR